jgi:hypothetical protein
MMSDCDVDRFATAEVIGRVGLKIDRDLAVLAVVERPNGFVDRRLAGRGGARLGGQGVVRKDAAAMSLTA